MGVTVKVTGGDKYKRFLDAMSRIAGSVKAGIFDDATNGTTGEKIAPYAIYNEFGATINVTPKMRAWFHYQDIHLSKDTDVINIPARPFMRTVAKSDAPKKWVGGMVRYLKGKAKDPEAWKTALGGAGEQMAKDIQNSIQNGSWVPNSPATVKMKADKGKNEPNHPLMDTGDMFHAVRSEVFPK